MLSGLLTRFPFFNQSLSSISIRSFLSSLPMRNVVSGDRTEEASSQEFQFNCCVHSLLPCTSGILVRGFGLSFQRKLPLHLGQPLSIVLPNVSSAVSTANLTRFRCLVMRMMRNVTNNCSSVVWFMVMLVGRQEIQVILHAAIHITYDLVLTWAS